MKVVVIGLLALACRTAGSTSGNAGVASEIDRTLAEYRVAHPISAGKMQLIEVTYGPGASSAPHRHSCPVIGYVVEGAIRSALGSDPETVYSTGESFFEAAGSLHAVSGNASTTRRAKLLAIFICPDSTRGSGAPPTSE